MQVVWFKRDLRIIDNAALYHAAQNAVVMPLYIIEPELWQQSDMSHRHYQFLCQSLDELDKDLQSLGQGLIIKIGNAVDILEDIYQRHHIDALWSHQETWNGWTYQRDIKIKQWAEQQNIPWHEPTQHGVVRRLKDRDGWAAHWYRQMKQPICKTVQKLTPINEETQTMPNAEELGLCHDGGIDIQQGGREAGLTLLQSFLYQRGEHYTKEMSSPCTAFDGCSRISPYLAFGCLSLREVFHASETRAIEIRQLPYGHKGKWQSAIKSFSGRLRWHCHFIQKLEDEPRIEFENMHPAYDQLRGHDDFNDDYFQAWKTGNTGYPMIDACMRALIATGWINFRMRAMLMSFASYHLWLDWRQTAPYLARLFTDYEPGIHYSQAQMQSGTTGINAIRIYNPIKQGKDHDPDGVFIRQWIPELSQIDCNYIHEPWKTQNDLMSPSLNGYPMPIIDEKHARKTAADKIYAMRKNSDHKEISRNIVHKHGSRKSGLPRTIHNKRKATKKQPNLNQAELPL